MSAPASFAHRSHAIAEERRDERERDAQLIALRLASPMRPGARAIEDVNHTPLFIAANEPELF